MVVVWASLRLPRPALAVSPGTARRVTQLVGILRWDTEAGYWFAGVHAAVGADGAERPPDGAEHHGVQDCHEPEVLRGVRGGGGDDAEPLPGPGQRVHERQAPAQARLDQLHPRPPHTRPLPLPRPPGEHAQPHNFLRDARAAAVDGGHAGQ
eukprot:4164960-Pyramimonas_sp.AAC.1